MSPNTVLPPEAQESKKPGSPLEKLLANKSIIGAIAGVVAVILVAYLAVGMMNRSAVKADDKAWGAFYEGFTQLREQAGKEGVFFSPGTAEFHQALDPDFQVRVFNDVLQTVRGSSAEPATLFYLGNAYLVGRKLDLAKQTFAELRDKYKDHYLVNADKTYLSQTLVDQAMNAIKNEEEWLDKNPNFLSGNSSSESDISGDESAEEDEAADNDEAGE